MSEQRVFKLLQGKLWRVRPDVQLGKQRTALSNNTTHTLSVMSATHFNRGPAYGMSAEVKSKVRVAKMLGVCMCVERDFEYHMEWYFFKSGMGLNQS